MNVIIPLEDLCCNVTCPYRVMPFRVCKCHIKWKRYLVWTSHENISPYTGSRINSTRNCFMCWMPVSNSALARPSIIVLVQAVWYEPVIPLGFCICAIVISAKSYCDMMAGNGITAKRNVNKIWIVIVGERVRVTASVSITCMALWVGVTLFGWDKQQIQ